MPILVDDVEPNASEARMDLRERNGEDGLLLHRRNQPRLENAIPHDDGRVQGQIRAQLDRLPNDETPGLVELLPLSDRRGEIEFRFAVSGLENPARYAVHDDRMHRSIARVQPLHRIGDETRVDLRVLRLENDSNAQYRLCLERDVELLIRTRLEEFHGAFPRAISADPGLDAAVPGRQADEGVATLVVKSCRETR